MHIHFHLSPTTHLAVVRLAFAPSQLTQLNDRSFACNLLSPSAVSPLQLTTSAHPCPAFTFRLPPSSGFSAPVSRCFLFLPCILRLLSSPSSCTSGYSAFCSSFRPSIGSASQWLSQRPALASRLLQIFPFHPVWFPIQSFRFCLFSLLFVSFQSSLLRSHSRSTGARFSSPSSPPVPSRVCSCRSLPFVHIRFRAHLLGFCFFLSLHPGFPSQSVLRCPSFHQRFRLFPCVTFRSWYSAFLQFLFPLLKFRLTGATPSADLPLRIAPSSSAAPLGFRFRFRYSSSGDTP